MATLPLISILILHCSPAAAGAPDHSCVMHKGAQRILGAGAGTILGTLIANTFAPLDHTSVVVIFAVLALATWVRPLSYA